MIRLWTETRLLAAPLLGRAGPARWRPAEEGGESGLITLEDSPPKETRRGVFLLAWFKLFRVLFERQDWFSGVGCKAGPGVDPDPVVLGGVVLANLLEAVSSA